MILAIDVGGTKTLLACFSDDGTIADQFRFETPLKYEDFLIELEINVNKFTTNNFRCCVAALPGKVDRTNGIGIVFGNLSWSNIPFVKDVGAFVDCPIYIENDANLAGLSEAQHLLPEIRRILYVTVSTGIGGVMVVNGAIDVGLRDAEIGHMLLEHNNSLMRWEEFASGKAIVASRGKRASEITDPQDWYLVARNIAVGLINVIAAYTPECVVFGGGVGSHFEKFEDKLKSELELYADKMIAIPKLRKAVNAEGAVIYGCYHYAKTAV
jgi:glucokinase